MVKTYQYRIYPIVPERILQVCALGLSKQQAKTLNGQLEACKNIYNQSLAWRKQAYEEHGESVNYGTQQAALTTLRAESSFWSTLHIDILQDAARRVDKAFKAFFRYSTTFAIAT